MEFLDYLGLPNRKETRQVLILSRQVDGFDPKTNTIYEFLGDYWHGNPDKFIPSEFNKKANKTFEQLYAETMQRLNLLKKGGFTIKYIWGSDWKVWNKNHNLFPLPIKEL